MFYRSRTAGDICSRIVSVVHEDLPVVEAARAMRDQHVGCLVVVERGDQRPTRVIGILTDRDIVTAVVAAGKPVSGLCVGDVMSRDVITVSEHDAVLDALTAMRANAVRRTPVVDAGGCLIGLLSIDDTVSLVASQMQLLAAAVGAARRHESAASPGYPE